jgi:phosphate transport system substrate-binding protein
MAFLWLLLATWTASAESLSTGGTGSAEPLLRLLFEEFRKQNPTATLKQIPALGSGGAIKALSAGRVDLAIAARSLTPEEARAVGPPVIFAETPLVLASHAAQTAAGFTLEQLAQVYAGQLQTWQDGSPIRLILRPSFESDTLMLRSMSPAMERAVTAATLRPGMVTIDGDLDAVMLLAATPGSLGPTTLGLLKASNTRLTVFSINGVLPSLATLQDGSYPWRKQLSIVPPLQPSQLAKRFTAFLHSDAARRLLRRYDYLPSLR